MKHKCGYCSKEFECDNVLIEEQCNKGYCCLSFYYKEIYHYFCMEICLISFIEKENIKMDIIFKDGTNYYNINNRPININSRENSILVFEDKEKQMLWNGSRYERIKRTFIKEY